MSTDARQTNDSLVEQIDAPPQNTEADDFQADRVEVLIRLPDLRNQHSAAKSPPDRAGSDSKSDSKNSDSNPHGLLGPIFDTLRHRWSTWKNAAMFAQAGVLTRSLIVGGLMLGMVIAAYVLMNRREEPANPEVDAPNTAQFPAPEKPDVQPELVTTPRHFPSHNGDHSMGSQELPDWAAARLDDASMEPVPTAHLELETNELGSDVVQPAVNIVNQPSSRPDVHSADSRNQSRTMPRYESRNVYGDTPAARNGQRPTYERYDDPAARNAQRPNYERYDDPAARGYRDTGERFNSPGPRNPAEQYRSRTDTGYAPRHNNSNPPNNAGFRGTIEPAPYRIR
jgi:hypothetical protein